MVNVLSVIPLVMGIAGFLFTLGTGGGSTRTPKHAAKKSRARTREVADQGVVNRIIMHLEKGPLWTMKWEEELKVLLPIRRLRRARYLCACYSWSYHS